MYQKTEKNTEVLFTKLRHIIFKKFVEAVKIHQSRA